MARRTGVIAALAVAGALVVGAIATIAVAQSGTRFDANRMRATFEVPVVSSDARGSFEGTLNSSTNTVTYELEYRDLESDVRQAHIHFAQTFASGGISVWLCETTQNPAPAAVAAATPDCPTGRNGTVNDTFNAAEVIGPAGQGIDAMEFSALLAAMRAGNTYANVHSASIPGGEIRGQLRSRGGGDDDDDD
jgi:CHRD domain